jgi:trk system potassium uptake protein TrkA
MGKFGTLLGSKMLELGNDVMIVDKNEKIINELSSIYTNALIGNCTNESVLKSLGLNNFNICFVTIGDDFQSSLEITSLLKDNGAKYVISKADRDIQAKFLLKNGADEVVYPERDIAIKLATRCSATNLFEFIELTNEYAIFETAVPKKWIGNTLKDINVRQRFNVNIIAIKNEDNLNPIPNPDYSFQAEDHIVFLGKSTDVNKFNN